VSTKKKLGENAYFKGALAVALIVAIVLAGYVGMRLAFGTAVPIRVVESGSMCVDYGGACDGWSHPFDATLHVGDILLIQAVQPEDLNANYPNSDIIVYDNPGGVTPIVHRIVTKQVINGTLYFKTKGDGNGPTLWPNKADYYDNLPDYNGVPANLVEGKVVMRIPWVGLVTLFMRDNPWGIPVVVLLVLLVAALIFVLPSVKRKRKQSKQQNDMHRQS
jgi:signal peptidase I